MAQARSVPRWGRSGHVAETGVGQQTSPDRAPSRVARCRAQPPAAPAAARTGRRADRLRRQAESFARPRRRRAFRTAWPARVDIRCRKPCFRARFRLFGWNVRFISFSSSVLARCADHETRAPNTGRADARLETLRRGLSYVDAPDQASRRTGATVPVTSEKFQAERQMRPPPGSRREQAVPGARLNPSTRRQATR